MVFNNRIYLLFKTIVTPMDRAYGKKVNLYKPYLLSQNVSNIIN